MSLVANPVSAQERWPTESIVLSKQLHHLRSVEPQEWTEFPVRAEGTRWEQPFTLDSALPQATLAIRQQDVRLRWEVRWDDQLLGELNQDENDLWTVFELNPEQLSKGEHRLSIQPRGMHGAADDIRVGQFVLIPLAKQDYLNATRLEVSVHDESGQLIPARLTLVDEAGVLLPLGQVTPSESTAVRVGTVYTGTGRAVIHLPTGFARVIAGRGFEYSLDQREREYDSESTTFDTPWVVQFKLERQVDTTGWVACDPHIHSLTHSGHGDATVQERMITIAAEGIELPIATDHNVAIDHRPFAQELELLSYFTPVVGNEVTTPVGHFDIFPVDPQSPLPNHQLTDWKTLFESIRTTAAPRIIILNHARDLHSGVRPFGPRHFNQAVGTQVDGWSYEFNAMEIINSSATQSDPLQLTRDWMTLLHRGESITPIGSSDSHDVLRHFVGQGRTYVACSDLDPGAIDVEAAFDSLVKGRVRVSYGLLVELEIEGSTSGEVASVAATVSRGELVSARIRVQAPDWIEADEITLYVNGEPVRTEAIRIESRDPEAPGLLYQAAWPIENLAHDVQVVAIATGPGIAQPHWRTAKPYQSVSPVWNPKVMGISGAVGLDADGDGSVRSARDYASMLWHEADTDWQNAIRKAAHYDVAVAMHLAELFHQRFERFSSIEWERAQTLATAKVWEGFLRYQRAAQQVARAAVDERE